jgi:UDP-N-acetylglucosamine 2-epimerase
MRIVSVVGTRPQLIKASVLMPALASDNDHVFVDTGQHWDEDLAGRFFRELDLDRPDYSLGVRGGTQAEQTAALLAATEPILRDVAPDVVVVYGDTNSTLAGALAAAKLAIPIAHVEAGLRSFDRTMPEEVNRVVVDHLSRWLFAPTDVAAANLATEGIHDGVIVVGDLMQDVASSALSAVRSPEILNEVEGVDRESLASALAPGCYLFATVHRAENRRPGAMREWLELLSGLARAERPVLLALHPGTRAALDAAALSRGDHVHVIPPQGYRTTLALQLHAAAVVTDSGGVQRESAWLGVPCLILRSSTEWTDAVERSDGRMRLVGRDAAVARRAIDELAPAETAPADARRRAERVSISAVGAASRIAAGFRESAILRSQTALGSR